MPCDKTNPALKHVESGHTILQNSQGLVLSHKRQPLTLLTESGVVWVVLSRVVWVDSTYLQKPLTNWRGGHVAAHWKKKKKKNNIDSDVANRGGLVMDTHFGYVPKTKNKNPKLDRD